MADTEYGTICLPVYEPKDGNIYFQINDVLTSPRYIVKEDYEGANAVFEFLKAYKPGDGVIVTWTNCPDNWGVPASDRLVVSIV